MLRKGQCSSLAAAAEGLCSLARFSTAVDKYYTIPRPNEERFANYIEALIDIVVQEDVKYFIPVSETNSAYYDALVKPHIEVLGCQCICPEVRKVLLLNDLMALMRKIQSDGLPIPNHYPIISDVELNRWYDFGIVQNEPYFMVNTGIEGCKSRVCIHLPNTRIKLKMNHYIYEQNPWLVIQDCKGEKFVTCMTMRDSQIVCNVTCKIDEMGGLMPIEKPEIGQRLIQFFTGLEAHREIIGHFSFYFTIPETGSILPTDCQVGVQFSIYLLYECAVENHLQAVQIFRDLSSLIMESTGYTKSYKALWSTPLCIRSPIFCRLCEEERMPCSWRGIPEVTSIGTE